MIYTVTLNPSLDACVSVKDFQIGKTNRTEEESIIAGGKGINVSKVLKNLEVESVAWGFLAGFTGEEIQRQLERENLATDFVKVSEGISRINWKLTSIEGTEINGQGPCISDEEAELFLQKMEALKKGDILFLAGSISPSLPKDFYEQIMQRVKDKEALVILDTSGESLIRGLSHAPFLIKPNHHELGELFRVEIERMEEAAGYAYKLQEKGAKNVLVSFGGKGAVLLTEDGQVFSAKAPEGKVLNTVGAGDAMLAGFWAGWMQTMDYEYAFRMAVAAGSASAFSKGFATKEEINELLTQIICKKESTWS